jgi:ATP-binding cassette subfamily B protein
MKFQPLPFALVACLGSMAAGDGRNPLRRGIVIHAVEAAAGVVPLVLIYLMLLELGGDAPQPGDLIWLALAGAGALALQYACGRAADREALVTGYSALCDLRLRIAEHLRSLPLGFFGKRRAGDLATVVADNVQMSEELLTHLIPAMIGHLLSALFVGVVLLAVDWRLGLAAIVTVPLGSMIMRIFRGYFAALHSARVAQIGEVSGRLLEFVQGIRVIRAFGLSAERHRQLDGSLKELRAISIRLETFGSLAFYSFVIVLEAGFLLVVFLGAQGVTDGAVAAPAFLMAMLLCQRLYAYLTDATSSFAMVSYMAQGVARIRAVMETRPLPVASSPKLPSGHDIEFDGVTFSYEEDSPDAPRDATIDNLSCRVPARALTAIVGRSGSGKSTMLGLIARFHDVRDGHVRIGGCDVRDIRPVDLLSLISMVFQDVYLFSGTVMENIRLGRPDAGDADVMAAARAAGCETFIAAFPQGYATRVGEGGLSLSGGERQRVSIARAILKDAPIVLLDEATASVDAENEREIRSSITKLTESKTVVAIAHRLETVMNADSIIVMDAGRIVESGTHETLKRLNGHYAALLKDMEGAPPDSGLDECAPVT